MIRSFVIRNNSIRALAEAVVRNLPINADPQFEVVIRLYKVKRRNEANALYWHRLSEISSQCWIQGRQYSAETLHEHCKREFLPEECAKGILKWTTLPTGDRALVMSSTDLNTSEFADYLESVTAFGTDLGAMFTADREGF